MELLPIMYSDRDVIGVEIFLINRGITKSKPKFKILNDFAEQHNIFIPEEMQEKQDRVYVICHHIQNDFRAFREWFKTYSL